MYKGYLVYMNNEPVPGEGTDSPDGGGDGTGK
jgi:hypothetical protein